MLEEREKQPHLSPSNRLHKERLCHLRQQCPRGEAPSMHTTPGSSVREEKLPPCTTSGNSAREERRLQCTLSSSILAGGEGWGEEVAMHQMNRHLPKQLKSIAC